MGDYPTVSFDYGHSPTRDERSAEVYRIGGLMDLIDATEIIAEAFTEFCQVRPEYAEKMAQAVLARMAHAEYHPILPCRVYDTETPRIELTGTDSDRLVEALEAEANQNDYGILLPRRAADVLVKFLGSLG